MSTPNFLTTALMTGLLAITAQTNESPANDAQANDHIKPRPLDQSVEHNVNRQLASTFRITPPDIQARVIAGQVTLRGKVHSYDQAHQVERAIEAVHGVRLINNRLRVRRDRSHIGDRIERINEQRAETYLSFTPRPQIVRGMIETIDDQKLIVRDFRDGPIETMIGERTRLFLDGQPVAVEALGSGLLVFVEAMPSGGDLIARSVEAHSPK